jgi:hypothetical protein
MIDSATNTAAPRQVLRKIREQTRRWFIDLVSIPVELNWQLHVGQLIEASAGEIMAKPN